MFGIKSMFQRSNKISQQSTASVRQQPGKESTVLTSASIIGKLKEYAATQDKKLENVKERDEYVLSCGDQVKGVIEDLARAETPISKRSCVASLINQYIKENGWPKEVGSLIDCINAEAKKKSQEDASKPQAQSEFLVSQPRPEFMSVPSQKNMIKAPSSFKTLGAHVGTERLNSQQIHQKVDARAEQFIDLVIKESGITEKSPNEVAKNTVRREVFKKYKQVCTLLEGVFGKERVTEFDCKKIIEKYKSLRKLLIDVVGQDAYSTLNDEQKIETSKNFWKVCKVVKHVFGQEALENMNPSSILQKYKEMCGLVKKAIGRKAYDKATDDQIDEACKALKQDRREDVPNNKPVFLKAKTQEIAKTWSGAQANPVVVEPTKSEHIDQEITSAANEFFAAYNLVTSEERKEFLLNDLLKSAKLEKMLFKDAPLILQTFAAKAEELIKQHQSSKALFLLLNSVRVNISNVVKRGKWGENSDLTYELLQRQIKKEGWQKEAKELMKLMDKTTCLDLWGTKSCLRKTQALNLYRATKVEGALGEVFYQQLKPQQVLDVYQQARVYLNENYHNITDDSPLLAEKIRAVAKEMIDKK